MKRHIKFIITTIILSACILFVYKSVLITSQATPISDNEFPSRIAGWTGEEVIYDKEVLSSLAPDKIIYKTFHKEKSGPPITLFMAYYNIHEKADLSHSPVVCFTGQGWEIKEKGRKEIPINLPNNAKITVNHMVQSKLDTTMITLFWFQSANRAFANRGIQKLFLFFENLLGRPDNNAFVRLTSIVPPGKSVVETTDYLSAFVIDLYPELEKFFL